MMEITVLKLDIFNLVESCRILHVVLHGVFYWRNRGIWEFFLPLPVPGISPGSPTCKSTCKSPNKDYGKYRWNVGKPVPCRIPRRVNVKRIRIIKNINGFQKKQTTIFFVFTLWSSYVNCFTFISTWFIPFYVKIFLEDLYFYK
jgi:hypothetical protein